MEPDSSDFDYCLVFTDDPLPGHVFSLVVAGALLLLSFLIAIADEALCSLSVPDLRTMKEKPRKGDTVLLRLLSEGKRIMNACRMLGVFLGAGSVACASFGLSGWSLPSDFTWYGFVSHTLALVLSFLFFGSIIPRKLAHKNPLGIARASAFALSGIDRALGHIACLFYTGNKTGGEELFGVKDDILGNVLQKDAAASGVPVKAEDKMRRELFTFHDKTASEVMTPRCDVDSIDIRTGYKAMVEHVLQCGYSRIPVYEYSDDNVKGILYLKDLVPHLNEPEGFEWQQLMRTPYFVPETKRIDDLMDELRHNKIHMGVVVNEFGGTEGIITLEDILEEIVGEISDEYDDDVQQYSVLGDGSIIFEAKIPLTDFFRATGLHPEDFDGLAEEPETLAGLILEIKGGYPARKEVVAYKDYRFQVLEMSKLRIVKVRYKREKQEEKGE